MIANAAAMVNFQTVDAPNAGACSEVRDFVLNSGLNDIKCARYIVQRHMPENASRTHDLEFHMTPNVDLPFRSNLKTGRIFKV